MPTVELLGQPQRHRPTPKGHVFRRDDDQLCDHKARNTRTTFAARNLPPTRLVGRTKRMSAFFFICPRVSFSFSVFIHKTLKTAVETKVKTKLGNGHVRRSSLVVGITACGRMSLGRSQRGDRTGQKSPQETQNGPKSLSRLPHPPPATYPKTSPPAASEPRFPQSHPPGHVMGIAHMCLI